MRWGGAVALPRLESFRANSKFGQHISVEKFKPNARNIPSRKLCNS